MTKDKSLLLIDSAGLIVNMAMIAGVGWYVFAKPDTASSQMHALSNDVSQLGVDLSQLQGTLDGQSARQQQLLAASESVGQLPTKSPIDQDLQRITTLARDHRVQLLEVIPVSTVKYPNVRELRYQIRTHGTYADHVQFLRSFEQCSFWADVTHMKIEQAILNDGAHSPFRRGELTVSFFRRFNRGFGSDRVTT